MATSRSEIRLPCGPLSVRMGAVGSLLFVRCVDALFGGSGLGTADASVGSMDPVLFCATFLQLILFSGALLTALVMRVHVCVCGFVAWAGADRLWIHGLLDGQARSGICLALFYLCGLRECCAAFTASMLVRTLAKLLLKRNVQGERARDTFVLCACVGVLIVQTCAGVPNTPMACVYTRGQQRRPHSSHRASYFPAPPWSDSSPRASALRHFAC